MPDNLVRLTLEKPYALSRKGNLRIKIAEEPSTFSHGTGGSEFANRVVAVKGKETWIDLEPVEGKNQAILPELIAKLHFGDWDAPEHRETGQGRETVVFSEERYRVANRWGGYLRADGTGIKVNEVDHSEYGPPNVPSVLIERLDGAGQPTGFKFRPYDFYGYKDLFPPVPKGVKIAQKVMAY